MKNYENQGTVIVETLEKIREEDILHDYTSTGREVPWAPNKIVSLGIATVFEALAREDFEKYGSDIHGYGRKAERIRNCASVLVFKDTGEKLKLHQASFCRNRLCSMCQYRRSLKVFGQVSEILEEVEKDKQYSYIMLTLTVKNVSGAELREEIDNLMKAWNRFAKYKAFQDAVKGFYRAMEVVHNIDYDSKSFDTYHPHFHCLLAVSTKYFKGEKYLSHEKWRALWKKAARLDYDPEVCVTKVKCEGKQTLQTAVAETAKYAVKSADYFIPDDWELTKDAVRVLDNALRGRRFIAFGGALKDARERLKLDDIEDGDLIHVDKDAEETGKEDPEITFYWYSGFQQYVRKR